MEMTLDEQLHYMIKARDNLNKIPKDERNNDFQKIYNDIENYILIHCNHVFINDYIDYTPEKSGSITYCCKCLYTQQEDD